MLRLLLLFRQRRMLTVPSVEPLAREEAMAEHEDARAKAKAGGRSRKVVVSAPALKPEEREFVRLARSGRTIRTLEAGTHTWARGRA